MAHCPCSFGPRTSLSAYASAEVACALQLHRFTVLGLSAPNLWLWIISAAAIATLLVLTVRAVRHRRRGESGGHAATVRIGAAVLALVGVLWSAVPIAFVDGAPICVHILKRMKFGVADKTRRTKFITETRR